MKRRVDRDELQRENQDVLLDKKKMLQIIMGVTLVGFIVCVGFLAYYYISLQVQKQKYEKLAATAVEIPTEVSTEIEEAYVSPIDFAKLQAEENADIYAWIQVDGTNIDYPVLQHPEDDTYYMTHNLDGSFGYPGCIFAELYNTKDFTDPVTVLYGHYMKDGSMFAGLHKFEDEKFFRDHSEITIYTPEEEHKYEILAAFQTDDRRLTVWYDFTEKMVLENYIDNILTMQESDTDHVRSDISATAEDRYIVLETCDDTDKTERYVVIAVEK